MAQSEIFKFLLYQQFYIDENIITDRRKEVNILVEGSGNIISKILEPLDNILSQWNSNIAQFLDNLGNHLQVDKNSCINSIEDKFEIVLTDKSTWEGFDDIQILTLTCTEFFKMFYSRMIKNGYNTIAQTDWDEPDRRSLLANEYSLLLNLLYLRELSKSISQPLEKVDDLINKLVPLFNDYKLDDYEATIKELGTVS